MAELMWVEITYDRPSGGQGKVRSTMTGSVLTEQALEEAGCTIRSTVSVVV